MSFTKSHASPQKYRVVFGRFRFGHGICYGVSVFVAFAYNKVIKRVLSYKHRLVVYKGNITAANRQFRFLFNIAYIIQIVFGNNFHIDDGGKHEICAFTYYILVVFVYNPFNDSRFGKQIKPVVVYADGL